jgi:hypothetical protein
VPVGFGINQWVGGSGPDPEGRWAGRVFADGDVMPNGKYSTGVGNAKTTDYKGTGGTDTADRQALDKLLLDKEVANQEILKLKKQLNVNEDFDRILKLAGLNR